MNAMEKIRAHLKIHGRVQGVFFRATTQEEALRLGLTGWVRNCPDGSVETVAEGELEKIEEFIRWCRHGPPSARVERVDVEKSDHLGEFKSFEMKYL
jgi:acylphosphatase